MFFPRLYPAPVLGLAIVSRDFEPHRTKASLLESTPWTILTHKSKHEREVHVIDYFAMSLFGLFPRVGPRGPPDEGLLSQAMTAL